MQYYIQYYILGAAQGRSKIDNSQMDLINGETDRIQFLLLLMVSEKFFKFWNAKQSFPFKDWDMRYFSVSCYLLQFIWIRSIHSYTHIDTHISTNMYMFMYICKYVCMCICISTYLCKYIYLYMFIYILICMYMCCSYIHVCPYVYVCMNVCNSCRVTETDHKKHKDKAYLIALDRKWLFSISYLLNL